MGLPEALVRAVSDMFITCDMQTWAKEQWHAGQLVYNYLFAHGKQENAYWARVAHIMELEYVFGLPFFTEHRNKYSDEDRRVSKKVIDYWGKFAHFQ